MATSELYAPPADLWTESERGAWLPADPIRPSEWAERHRRLTKADADITGPYRNANAPYLQGIMDIPLKPGVVQANVMKAAQIGVSEAGRNILGYLAHMEPDPVGLGLPNRTKGRKIVKNRLMPLFKRTPVLRELLSSSTRDVQLEQIGLLNGFLLHLMWSGSATATASDPMRVVFNDEVDKFESWAGDEPDAVARTWKRTRTYGDRRLQINVSTPTTTAGAIHQLYEASSVKLQFYVPCPHCGAFQRLIWTQVKWEQYKTRNKRERADLVMQNGAAWYECIHCGERIEEDRKRSMVQAGRWTTERGEVVDYWGEVVEDAEAVTRWPTGTRVGFQISALYCLWESWASVVSEFLLAEGDLNRSFNFRTETLGVPFENQVTRFSKNIFAQKCFRATLPAGKVPPWAFRLLATIDTQSDHFYVVVRAWGSNLRSQRVWHGKLMSFDELDRVLFLTTYPVADADMGPMEIAHALIDSGGTEDQWLDLSRTMQVYRWVIPRQAKVMAIKGASSNRTDGLYWRMKNPLGKAGSSKANFDASELNGLMVDTHRCNDLLADLIATGMPTERRPRPEVPEVWLLNQTNDPDYNQHMAAVHKTVEPGRQAVERWKPVHSGARHDYRDCEAYQVAAAYLSGVHLLPPEDVQAEIRQQEQEHREQLERNRTQEGESDAWTPTPM